MRLEVIVSYQPIRSMAQEKVSAQSCNTTPSPPMMIFQNSAARESLRRNAPSSVNLASSGVSTMKLQISPASAIRPGLARIFREYQHDVVKITFCHGFQHCSPGDCSTVDTGSQRVCSSSRKFSEGLIHAFFPAQVHLHPVLTPAIRYQPPSLSLCAAAGDHMVFMCHQLLGKSPAHAASGTNQQSAICCVCS